MSHALLTDRYELTMVAAALRDGTADLPCTFELFGRSLPAGRRYGVVGGTGRLVPLVAALRFGGSDLDALRATGITDPVLLEWLAAYAFSGEVDGFAEGEVWFPNTPLMVFRGTFAECVVLETLALSVLNHDSAVLAAAARMATAAGGRRLIEMGGRRTHEEAAVASARAAYVAGFDTTSNLQAAQTWGVPTTGTSAHAFTLLYEDEQDAFAAQVASMGAGTTLLVDTYDVRRGVERALAAAGPQLGAVRIDSGDLGVLAAEVREQLDAAGATGTGIVVTGDLDEFAIAALAAAPVTAYGVGTSLVTGSGAPTAGLVYKLVEADGRPVAKASAHKATRAGAATAWRSLADGVARTDTVAPYGSDVPADARLLLQPLLRGAEIVADLSVETARAHHAFSRGQLDRAALVPSAGEVAVATVLSGWA